jgi:transposase
VKIREYRNAGLTKKATAQRLGIDRKTVSKYWDGPAEDPEKPRYRQRPRMLDPYLKYITERLDAWPELTAERLYREIRIMGFDGSRRTVRRYVAEIRPTDFREYKPVETLPGEQAQVDWGHCGKTVVDGVEMPLYVFVFCLSWSRVRYVEFITSLNMATFFGCMHRALEYVGGVPREVLFDNAKTVVSERVGNVVRYNEELLRLAASYGFSPKACWTSDPESKGKVESNVKYVKKDFYYARSYSSLQDLNHQAWKWCDEVANRKVHGTTREVPFERLKDEAKYLQSLELEKPLFILENRKATKTQLISIEGNKYSVPPQFARKRIAYRRYEDRIELLDDREVVEQIELMVGKGKELIQDHHYPAHNQKKRVSNPLQARFEAISPSARVYLQGLSQSGTGQLREQMENILGLAGEYEAGELEAAMKRSIEFRAYGYGRLKRILEKQRRSPQSLPSLPKKPSEVLAPYSNIEGGSDVQRRNLSYYGRCSA